MLDQFVTDILTLCRFTSGSSKLPTDLSHLVLSTLGFPTACSWTTGSHRASPPLSNSTWPIVDLDNFFAAIPGDGCTPMVLTHSRDITRFVVAVLGIPRWEKRYHPVGDWLTVNDFVRIAEGTSGHSFEKHEDALDQLLMGRCTLVPAARKAAEQVQDQTSFVSMIAAAGVMVAQGEMDLPDEGNLNVMFPDIKTLSIQEAVHVYCSQS